VSDSLQVVTGRLTYLGELRTNWRFLAAAGVGMTAGYLLVNYIGNLFTPHLIQEFGWSRGDIALIGATAFLGIIGQPIVGRLADAFGVRRVALIGVVSAPLIFAALSAMSGSLLEYFLLCLAQVTIVGGTTTTVVYSRLIAQHFDRARGIALAIAACAAPATAAVSIPFLSEYIDSSGWRAGYLVVAACTAVGGAIAMLLIPAGSDVRRRVGPVAGDFWKRYGAIVRNPAFRLIVAGVILCNLSWTLQTAQFKVLLLDRGVDSATGSMAVSVFAFSVIVGRLLCGVALDRFPVHLVVAISLGLPGLGLGLLATGSSTSVAIAVAALLLGLALGAEGDVLAYTVMRYFQLEVYSTVLGLVLGSLALSVSVGSLLLGAVLKISGSFTPFLVFSAMAAFVGAAMFYLLKRLPTVA
jgi:MFS family permease